MNLKEKIISSENIYKGKILKLRKDEVLLPNNKHSKREIVELQNAAAVLAINKNGKIIFVKQYRCPYEEILLEIPAGKVNTGEEPLSCAKRELLEETGAKAKSIKLLAETYPSPGCLKERLFLYLAEELEYSKQHLDEDEFLEVYEFTLEEAISLIKKGEIKDAKTINALLLYKENIFKD